MGSLSSSTSATTAYTHCSWWTEYENNYVNVYVLGVKVTSLLGLGVHHYIACDGIDDKWRVVEWGISGIEMYASQSLHGNQCLSLGRHKLKDVRSAAENSAFGASYGTKYNCNHFTEKIASILGCDITVNWNCSCVL